MTAEWFYIGHYGQLGPLTREQIDELIEGGVIMRDTYVWREGMTDWLPADRIPDLSTSFGRGSLYSTPPPPPSSKPTPPAPPIVPARTYDPAPVAQHPTYLSSYPLARSDKSRTLGGILQLLIPGVGRIYLGYSAIGVLQLVLSLCGVGILWSWIDGVVVLAGGVKMDGYGRQLND